MPIKKSSARQIDLLLADLGSDRAAPREAAIARLTLVGGRAVDRLTLLVDSDAPPIARAAALRTLEAIGDIRALDCILRQIDGTDTAVACAATSAARAFLRSARGNIAVDRLTAAALDRTRDEQVRIAALRALGDLEPSTLAPLLAALQADPSDAVKAATRMSTAIDPAEALTRAADRGLQQEPEELGEAVSQAGATIALPVLLRVLERVRDRERAEPDARRAEWTRLRGRVHVALAARGSRMALYDLRESLEAAVKPLPVEFLAALSTAGDASCLEAIAAAYTRGDSGWWRDHLADAFTTIVKREQLTRRHTVVKKIQRRWGNVIEELWAGRTP